MNASVQENLVAARVVKSFAREDYEKKKFAASADDLKKAQIYAQKLFSLLPAIQMGIMWTCAVILMLMGGNQVFAGTLTKGELVSMLTYTNQVVGSVSMVAMIIMMLTMTRESVTRINEVLDEVPDITDNGSTFKVENGEIEFRHVDFSYSGKNDNLTLSDINLHIRAGETIGVVGGTGDGKSTLMQLIPRFTMHFRAKCLSAEGMLRIIHCTNCAKAYQWCFKRTCFFRHDSRQSPLGKQGRNGRAD